MQPPLLKPEPSASCYELARDYGVTVDEVEVVVPKRFHYRGANMLTLGWQGVCSPFDPRIIAASLVHDWLYHNHQLAIGDADRLFYRLLEQNAVDVLTRNGIWLAIKAAGPLYWPNDEEDIQSLVRLCRRVKRSPHFEKYCFPLEIQQKVNRR